MTEEEQDPVDWRKSLVQHKGRIGSEDEIKWFDRKYLNASIPLLDEVTPGVLKIFGTAFIYNLDGQYFLITAKHNVLNSTTGVSVPLLIGFQSEGNADGRYIMHDIDRSIAWLYLEDPLFHFAILPIEFKDETDRVIYHTVLDESSLFDPSIPHSTNDVLVLGYYHGKSGLAKGVDIELAKSQGHSDVAIEFMERFGFLVWIGNPSVGKVISQNYNGIFWKLEYVAISGLSGSPVFIHTQGETRLVGIANHSDTAIKIDDDGNSYIETTNRGLMYPILDLISQIEWIRSQVEIKPYIITPNNLKHYRVTYLKEDEMEFNSVK